MALIGLCGFAAAGKDTVAGFLHQMADFEKVGFADALREMALAIDPIVDLADGHEVVYYSDALKRVGYDEAKRQYPEVRRFLQRLGTEAVRKTFGEDAWVNALYKRVGERIAAGDHIVITDVRFPNEAAMVREWGQLWRIHRAGHGPANNHPSEMNQVDFEVDLELFAHDLASLAEATARACASTLGIPCITPVQAAVLGIPKRAR